MRRIAVMTAGADAPGMNAAIRAVARRSFELGYDVLMVRDGYEGLVRGDIEIMNKKTVSGILPLGGSILGSSRVSPEFATQNLVKIREILENNSITTSIIVGDRGAVAVASVFAENSIPCVVVPNTIDNDIFGTDFSIGFDSAITTISDALDKLHTTASAHHRVMIVEVMGRQSGWLALYGGLAGGADFIAIPEQPVSIETLATHLQQRKEEGKDFSIVVVAEGYPVGSHEPIAGGRPVAGYGLAEALANKTSLSMRVTVLGYLQRGGSPTVFDRLLATRLGLAAVNAVREGKSGILVGELGQRIAFTDLREATTQPHVIPADVVLQAKTFY
ncbi:MAG: ATP-dependent 6-phosphofructokinase [Candidatus Cryosericum sp.]